jgi:hypothetical protein
VLDSQSRSYLYRNFVVPAIDTFKRVTGRGNFEKIHACDKDPHRAAEVARMLFSNLEMAQTLVTSRGGRFPRTLNDSSSCAHHCDRMRLAKIGGVASFESTPVLVRTAEN